MTSAYEQTFSKFQNDPGTDRIVIIGGGVVGSALASYLSAKSPGPQVILLDDSLSNPQGSTAIAPGLVGQLNSINHLTVLAKATVAEYSKIQGAFQPVGGLEIARSQEGISQLRSRQTLAHNAGLPAEIVTSAEAFKLAPDFVEDDGDSKGLFFPLDGTANPMLIVQHYQSIARSRGVAIIPAKATSILFEPTDFAAPANHHLTVLTDLASISCKTIIVAAGIWTPSLFKSLSIDLPIIPVAQSYALGQLRYPRALTQPFVRWPERQVYARDHGEYDGFGTYDHEPEACIVGTSALSSENPQSAAIVRALSIFTNKADRASKAPRQILSGIFAVTPDRLPFAGAIPEIPGLFVAAAVWITHAAGVAMLVADMVSGKELQGSEAELRDALKPMRFEGKDKELLNSAALASYNDIYNQSNL